MKGLILLTVLLFVADNALGQFSGHPNALNITGSPNTLKSEIPLAEPVVIGSTYIDEQWQQAEIVLKDGFMIKGLQVRIEIEQANVEINYNGKAKYLDLEKVDFINYTDGQTATKQIIKLAAEFSYRDVPLKGIVFVHKGERYVAIKNCYIEFLQANYNVAMDVGSKHHRKVKKEQLYVTKDNQLIQIKGSEKKIASRMGDDEKKALTIIKQYKLNLSREADLYQFVDLL